MRLPRLALPLALALCGASCDAPPEPTPPGPLQVGVATVPIPAPVGIGTVGYGGFGVEASPSPFTDIYPATERLHGHPSFRAIAISRGPGHEVVLLRADTVGIFQHLRFAVVEELKARTGRDLDDALIIGGTHTHSGPGRIIDGGGPFDLIADTFLPELYVRLVDAMADAVELALDDLAPGRLGHAIAQAPDGHGDRRCEDGLDYKNSTVPVLVLEREGELAAVALAYAIHGTVLGIDDLTLSQDVSGAIEHAIADRFEHPVEVAMFNSWGADMSPANPSFPEEPGAALPSGYEQMERVGTSVADDVEAALLDITWDEDPVIAVETHRFRLDREAIGYEDDTFPYEWGAVYCGASAETDCDPETTRDGLDQSCFPFPEGFPAPNQTLFTAGRIGPLHLITFPGEPGTLLAEEVMAELAAWGDVEQVLFLGYAQDYTGYSILEHDWWQGGYEAGGALWGPRQGEYLRDMAVETYRRFRLPGNADQLLEPPPLPGFDPTHTPRVPTAPLRFGEIVADVPAAVGPDEIVTFTVAGADPWLGAPVAHLVHEDGSPATHANGAPVQSNDFAFWVSLTPVPAYRGTLSATEREFQWTFHLPAARRTPGWLDLDGAYRLEVTLPGDPDGGERIVSSGVFAVGAE